MPDDPPIEPQPVPAPQDSQPSGPADDPATKVAVDAAVERARTAWQKRLDDRDESIRTLKAEVGDLRSQAAATGLTKAEQREREAREQSAKDRALKRTAATAALTRAANEAIAEIGDGKTVDAEKVTAMIAEFVAPTINPDSDVQISIGDGGEVSVFMTTEAADALRKAVARVVELASSDAAPAPSPTAPMRPGPTRPRSRTDGSILDGRPPLVPLWDQGQQSTDVGKARAKIKETARAAGEDGLLGDMDTGL